MAKSTIFCKHAEAKFNILRQHGIIISKKEIIDVVLGPEKILSGGHFRKIAQKPFNSNKLLRVIFEETKDSIIIITFYPAKRRRYENQL